MVQVAQSGAAKVGEQELSVVVNNGLLPLEGTQPVSVYVRISDDGNEALFSRDQICWYSEGMSWPCDDEYALYITYILITPDIELMPSRIHRHPLWFSPVLQPSSGTTYPTQLGYAPPLVDTYHFRVHVESLANGGNGTDIDPQIIVTPL